jgi:hypothetical protein
MNAPAIVNLSLLTFVVTGAGLIIAWSMWWGALREWHWQYLLTPPKRLIVKMRRRNFFLIVLMQGYLAFESLMTAWSLSRPDIALMEPLLSPAQIHGLWMRMGVRVVITGLISLGCVNTWHDRKRLEDLL